jgi:hypothetical protein
MAFQVGDLVPFAGTDSLVSAEGERSGRRADLIENGESRLPMWIPEDILESHRQSPVAAQFRSQTPSVLGVDDFFDKSRRSACPGTGPGLRVRPPRFYKVLRTPHRFLWP